MSSPPAPVPSVPDETQYGIFGAPRQEQLCTVFRLGRVPYSKALALQRGLVASRKAHEIEDTLLLVEHDPVITLGRNAKREHLVSSAEQLEQQHIEVLEIERGGDVTYHGPGQLVGYPILDLSLIRKDVVWYVRTLEEVLIRACSEFGVVAGRVKGFTGVWVDGAKVAAIGVHISRWVTSHGFALNVETDLAKFRHIIPCGIAGCAVTSLTQLLRVPVSREQVEDNIVKHMGELFGLRMQSGDPESVRRREAWQSKS
jgi:lipoyl(octanoyl) transferase